LSDHNVTCRLLLRCRHLLIWRSHFFHAIEKLIGILRNIRPEFGIFALYRAWPL